MTKLFERFENVYEELFIVNNDWAPRLQVNYDDLGVIADIFLYSEFTNGLVKVNIELFETRHSTRYAYLQERVNEQLHVKKAE